MSVAEAEVRRLEPFGEDCLRKTPSDKGSVVAVEKKAKQRDTWALFVKAAGQKEDPIVIGKSAKHRCFKKLEDVKPP